MNWHDYEELAVILGFVLVWYKMSTLRDYIDKSVTGYTDKELKEYVKEQKRKRLEESKLKRKVIVGEHETKNNTIPLTDFIKEKENGSEKN